MGPPPITVYLTTIASQPALRQRQEYLLRILQSKRIPFSSYDLASDEDAKKLWRRKAPADKAQLPGILVGGKFIGTFQDFEEAVEYNELNQFLRRNEEWDEEVERPSLPVKAIGVPGASLPMQMTPEHIRTKILAVQSSPLKGAIPKPINKEPEGSRIDIGEELSGFGLQGVKVTDDELRDMIQELGLGGDDAEDLLQGLSDSTHKTGLKGGESLIDRLKEVAPAAAVEADETKEDNEHANGLKNATLSLFTKHEDKVDAKQVTDVKPEVDKVDAKDIVEESQKVAPTKEDAQIKAISVDEPKVENKEIDEVESAQCCLMMG